MERVREPIRSLRPGEGTLVRVARIVGVGLRESTDGAVVLRTESGAATVHGSVLRGVADAAIIDAGPARNRIDVSIDDAEASEAGLVCGGRATLLLSPLTELPDEATQWLADSEPVVVASALDASDGDLVLSPHGTAGSLGSESLDEAAARTGRGLIRSGASAAEVHTIDGKEILFSAAIPTTRALIVGSGPMADAFAAQGTLMGWQVEMTESAERAVAFCNEANRADALVVLSHDPAVDTPALAAGLEGNVGYIGAMGSRHTQVKRAQRLNDLGHSDRSRIHGPVGLDLGSRTPAETAVAMAAEFLAVRRGRPPASLSDHDGPIHQ